MKNIKICTVVTGKTIREFLRNLDLIQAVSDMVELRIDYIKEIKLSDLETIKKALKKEAIFTCRKKEEGGKFLENEEKRLLIIQKALDLDFDFFDIELTTLEEEKIKIPSNKKKGIIVSYHNFKETPFELELRKLIFYMRNYGEIIKIATMVKNDYDNLKLFRLMVNKKYEEKRIIIGMGKKGKMTRIIGPFLGNYLTYASTEFSQSAPGQIDIKSLKKIYEYFG